MTKPAANGSLNAGKAASVDELGGALAARVRCWAQRPTGCACSAASHELGSTCCHAAQPSAGKAARVNLVQTQPFASTFGKQATRKRPKLSADSYADMLQMVRRLRAPRAAAVG